MFYIQLDSGMVGRTVSEGNRMGVHTSLHCSDCYDSAMTDHVHLQLYQNGNIINPTSKVDC